MDRLSRGASKGTAALGLALLCVGCPSPPKEVSPPPESFAIASAAPHALGALAAGTDAAPRALAAPSGPLRADPDEGVPDSDDETDGGAASPDAGLAPEDLPL